MGREKDGKNISQIFLCRTNYTSSSEVAPVKEYVRLYPWSRSQQIKCTAVPNSAVYYSSSKYRVIVAAATLVAIEAMPE